MRRGHAGIGGWQNENQRHFRSRGGGTSYFRPPRGHNSLETSRFPPPNSRPHRDSHIYPNRLESFDLGEQLQHERNTYRENKHRNSRSQDRMQNHRPNQNYYNTRQKSAPDHSKIYNDNNFYQDANVNNRGDMERSHSSHNRRHAPYGPHPISPWANPPNENQIHYYDNHNVNKTLHRLIDSTEGKLPSIEYSGHRPPSSDYYVGVPPISNNNNTGFSRSVDDTVDIVKKRLLNRNEPQPLSEVQTIAHETLTEQSIVEKSNINFHNPLHTPPVKKKMYRQKQNCDKIKNKIVHQLFKMDKDKIHKLMDNPHSSSKFEYAISNLITESQNSYNRHVRSAAEKSLCNSSSEFIHNDNNTIYEDTFMKQMQCILDPQDTVLLEDIKPLVLAELSKVLQLGDLEQVYEIEDQGNFQYHEDEASYSNYNESYHNSDEYHQDMYYNQNQRDSQSCDSIPTEDTIQKYSNQPNPNVNFNNIQPLYERRPSKNNYNLYEEERLIQRQARKSIEARLSDETFKPAEETVPLFDTNLSQSEEDDPFADLDNLYHVAVDHNFIGNDDSPKPQQSNNGNNRQNLTIKKEVYEEQEKQSVVNDVGDGSERLNLSNNFKEEPVETDSIPHSDNSFKTKAAMSDNNNAKHEKRTQKQTVVEKAIERTENATNLKTSSPSNARKRSIDQRPSHRKEKRKKSNDSYNRSPEKSHGIEKTTHNLNLTKSKSTEKDYLEKYVKRKEKDLKEPNKKPKEKESETKKRTLSSSSHSIVSPKESSNSSTNTTQSISKDGLSLKPINMFVEKPRKVNMHVSHRNTALTSTVTNKNIDENKPQVQPANRKVMKHVATQMVHRYCSKLTQTYKTKIDKMTKSTQTEPVIFSREISSPKDAFGRMKEIDSEIQALLQEKFKLYNSIESKDNASSSSLVNLGMTVVNVAPEDLEPNEDANILLTEVCLTDDLTVPVEQLEQITVLESISEEIKDSPVKPDKRSKRLKELQRNRKTSESSNSKRSIKKPKSPNISLIEQIITDDRPIEEIISLDELENTPVKGRRTRKRHSKKKSTKKGKNRNASAMYSKYNLKECSVVLVKLDMNRLYKPCIEESLDVYASISATDGHESEGSVDNGGRMLVRHDEVEVDNDLQFDMLDVSEDIVIGDSCEVRSDADKDTSKDRMEMRNSEEIILVNTETPEDANAAEVLTTENECKMFDYSNDENLRRDSVVVTGNADAVLAIESVENDFIAACLNGNVYHFSGDGQLINTLRGSNLAVTCLTIVKERYGTTVYTGSLDSRIRYYDLETGLEKGLECNVLSPIQTMDRAWDTIFVGTRTGFVLQFECKNNMLIPVSTVKFSEQSILALRALKEGPRKVLLVAARSEDVTIKDAQTGLLLRTLNGPSTMTVYTLLFEDGKVYCGTSTHQIQVFDYSSGSHIHSHEGGKGAVCLRATGGLLFAGCYDGCVYVYREGEIRPLAQLRGPSLMLLSLAIVGTKIIAGYKDRSLYIWKIPLSILQEMIL